MRHDLESELVLDALALHLEIGDWSRFQRASDVGAYVGLVPTLEQSGQSSTSGGITKTGSQYARRLLVEAAWHYTRPPRIGATMTNRQQGVSAHILQIAWRAQQRLYRMHTSMRDQLDCVRQELTSSVQPSPHAPPALRNTSAPLRVPTAARSRTTFRPHGRTLPS